MIEGKFSGQGELIFEIDFVASDGLIITVDALFDTGFTDWLAINTQDALSLGWELVESEETRLTAQGETHFDIYTGTVSLDTQEFNIPVIAGDEIAEVLLGLPWLFTRRLVVDFPQDVLTLG
ncbi:MULTISPECIES: aspartyl protease [Nostoc]|uniref:Aspartyl protease n=1 Tax=Nostoc paludosum FACHB-159 TaxID=2692908 RepID=A0ABR8K298_9NOSO|nr:MULTISPECIES: aspartyl protease [Nostoc]MBD2676127.1 aspartyl protease [Nostoc sp. FACHB-857]MBD2732743.1 aspartyl protease [Nostoc paludosum FACHB-159]